MLGYLNRLHGQITIRIKTAPPNIARSNRVNLTQAALVVNFWLLRFQIDIVAASELHLSLFTPTNNRPNCPSSSHGHASDIRLATTARILSDADARSTPTKGSSLRLATKARGGKHRSALIIVRNTGPISAPIAAAP